MMDGLIKGAYKGESRFWFYKECKRNRSSGSTNGTLKRLLKNRPINEWLENKDDKLEEFLLPLELV